MAFHVVFGDVTKLKVDAVVNAANDRLLAGSGVCGAIFREAGYEELTGACRSIGACPTGSAVITPAFRLPAKYVIHAVGPRWHGGYDGEEEKLRSCYRASLELAAENGCCSIAFPLISSGIFGYPKEDARRIAEETIAEFLGRHEMEVTLVLFDPTR